MANSTQTVIQKEELPAWYQAYLQQLIGNAGAVAGEAYTPYTGARLAGFAPETEQAFQMARNSVGSTEPVIKDALAATRAAGTGSATRSAQPWFASAAGADPRAAAQPFISQAMGMSGSGSAQPAVYNGIGMMTAAGGATFPGAVDAYMNPYTDKVVDRIGDLAARTLTEKLLPGIREGAVSTGTFGGRRQAEITGRTIRDLSETTTAAQAEALRAGYNEAGQLFNADASRRLSAGQGVAQAGTDYGALVGQDRSTVAGLGELAGNFADRYGGRMVDIGSRTGELAAGDLNRTLEAGRSFASMVPTIQNAQTTDIARLDTIGQQRQGQTQASYDLAYDDFQRQQRYPQEQLGFLSNIIRGQNIPTSSSTQTTNPGGNKLAQVAGLATSAASLAKLAGAFADGGAVPKRKMPPMRGIGEMARAA